MKIAGKCPEAYQTFFRSSSDAVILFSPLSWAVIDCTNEALRVLRFAREELLDHDLRMLFRDRPAQFCQEWELPDSTAEREFPAVVVDGTGVERPMSVLCRPLHLDNGPVLCATFKDVSEASSSRNVPDFSRVTPHELVDAAPFLVTGRVQGGFIHEINNSNNVILMNVSLLKEFWNELSPLLAGIPADDAEVQSRSLPLIQVLDALPKLLDGIRDGSERVRSVTGVARSLATSSLDRSEGLDVNVVVKNCILLLTSTINKRAKEVEVTLADDLPVVQANSSEFMAVVIATALKILESNSDRKQILQVNTMRGGQKFVSIEISAVDQGGARNNGGLQQLLTSRNCPPQFSDLDSLLIDAIIGSYGGRVDYLYSSGESFGIACICLYWPEVPIGRLPS